MDDLYHERVVAVERVHLFSLLWSYGEILAFRFNFRDLSSRCRTVNQPSIDVREVDPNFVVATVILFLETQRAVGDGKGACGLAILCQNQVVFRTRTRPTIHLARLLVTTTVWGRVAQVSPYGSRITARLASSFFPKQRFLTKWLMCSDIMVKKDLPLRGSLRNDAREMTACKNHPDCPSLIT